MELIRKFYTIVCNTINEVIEKQEDTLKTVVDAMYHTITSNNIIHVFGTGHSHLLAEECFFRAGGFIPVNAILEESLMIHAGASSSSKIERLGGYAEIILNKYNIRSGDMIFIFSNSGINNVPVEMAIAAKEKGMTVVALTCLKHSVKENSRHLSGKKLYQIADYCIDNGGEFGDASIDMGAGIKVAPTSTAIGTVIMHGLFAEVADKYYKSGKTPPVYLSANVSGGNEHNMAMIQNYKDRLKHLA